MERRLPRKIVRHLPLAAALASVLLAAVLTSVTRPVWTQAISGAPRFTRAFRDGGLGGESAFALAAAPDGSVYLGGDFTGTTTIAGTAVSAASGSANDGFLAKYAQDGAPQWVRTVSSDTTSNIVHGVAVASDGSVYATGYFSGTATFDGATRVMSHGGGDFFLVKYAADGTFQWVQTGGSASTYDEGMGIAFDASGHVYVAGYYGGTATFGTQTLTDAGGNYWHWMLLEYQPDGTLAYAKDAGGGTTDQSYPNGIVVDGNALYVAGETQAADASFGGFPVADHGGANIVVAKYGLDGSGVWASSAGGSGDDYANGITALDGSLYVAGWTSSAFSYGPSSITNSGGTGAVLAKYAESDGTVLWAGEIAGAGDDAGRAVVAANGSIYLSGYFSDTAVAGATTLSSQGGSDPFLAAYAADGRVLWAVQGGGAGDATPALTCGMSGTAVVCGGFFTGTVAFGGFSLTSAGGNDLYADTVREIPGPVRIEPLAVPVLSFSASSSPHADGRTIRVTYAAGVADHVPVENVRIEDQACLRPPAYVSGDADGDGVMQPGETWIFVCDRPAKAAASVPVLYAEGNGFLVSQPAPSSEE